MAIEGVKEAIPGLVTVTDLSASQYLFVKMSADNTVAICSGATDCPIGVLDNAPKGAAATPLPAGVTFKGVTKVVLGGTVTAGQRVGQDGAGKCIAIVEGTGTTLYIAGVALEGGAVNEIRSILLSGIPHRAA